MGTYILILIYNSSNTPSQMRKTSGSGKGGQNWCAIFYLLFGQNHPHTLNFQVFTLPPTNYIQSGNA